MGRERPVHEPDFDANGWDFDELEEGVEPFALTEPLVVGSRVSVGFLFETNERDEDDEPLVAAMEIPVQVIRVEGESFVGVLLGAPSTEATLCLFSAVRFGAQHVTMQFDRKKPTEELEMMESALKKEPRNAELLFVRAALKEKCGDQVGAIADLTQCIDAGDTRHEARASRGMCHGVIGDEDAARADFERALLLAQAEGDHDTAEMLEETLAMLHYAFGTLPDA